MLRSLTFNFRRQFSAERTATVAKITNDMPSSVAKTATDNSNATNSDLKYTSNSIRTGALGIKKGMMSYWDTWGKIHPVTILHVNR